MAVSPDANTWQDIPLYVRAGSILATQPAERGNELSPAAALIPDAFPSATRVASFLVYDDDGDSYDYEKGGYFRQEITATQPGRAPNVEIAPATGAYRAHFPSYLLRVHQASAGVTSDGQTLTQFASASALESSGEPGWFSTTDRFGAVTEVRIGTDAKPHSLTLVPR
jgi:hypothetical protein